MCAFDGLLLPECVMAREQRTVVTRLRDGCRKCEVSSCRSGRGCSCVCATTDFNQVVGDSCGRDYGHFSCKNDDFDSKKRSGSSRGSSRVRVEADVFLEDERIDCMDCKRSERTKPTKSDCDSDSNIRTKRKPKNSWKRYINICATLCLLLYADNFCQRVQAAPMQEITRRQTSRLPDAQKDRLNSARRVLLKTVLENKEVLDLFIKVRFSGVRPNEDGMRWLTTDRFPWLQDDVYPKEISFDGHASDDTLSNVNVNFDEIMPLMEKTLKLVEHGLERVVVSVQANDRLKEGAGHLVTSLTRLVGNVKQIQRNFEELLSLRSVPKTSDTNEDSSNVFEKSATSESFRLDWLIVKDSILYLQYLKDATNEVLGLNH